MDSCATLSRSTVHHTFHDVCAFASAHKTKVFWWRKSQNEGSGGCSAPT